MIHVRGTSGRRFSFSKRPGEGYIYETKDEQEAEEMALIHCKQYLHEYVDVDTLEEVE